MCKLKITVELEGFKTPGYKSMKESYSDLDKISAFYKSMFEVDSNISSIKPKIEKIEICN